MWEHSSGLPSQSSQALELAKPPAGLQGLLLWALAEASLDPNSLEAARSLASLASAVGMVAPPQDAVDGARP